MYSFWSSLKIFCLFVSFMMMWLNWWTINSSICALCSCCFCSIHTLLVQKDQQRSRFQRYCPHRIRPGCVRTWGNLERNGGICSHRCIVAGSCHPHCHRHLQPREKNKSVSLPRTPPPTDTHTLHSYNREQQNTDIGGRKTGSWGEAEKKSRRKRR